MADDPFASSRAEVGTLIVRIGLRLELHYDVGMEGADFVLLIHAAQTGRQWVEQESFQTSPPLESRVEVDPVTANRYLRLRAPGGPLALWYAARLQTTFHLHAPTSIGELRVDQLPLGVLTYLNPSRYCPSDRLQALAWAEFGHLPSGYGRVVAIREWIGRKVRFESNTSDNNTSAMETLAEGRGVCRDFAHLMIALCRALSIPARFTTGTDFGADPSLGPPDFHAYVEVYLAGGWFVFDPSGTAIPMGLIRIATGRDAADVPFAAMYGAVKALGPPQVATRSLDDAQLGFAKPVRCQSALSSDAGP